MPKNLAADLDERILKLVASSDAGASRGDIARRLRGEASDRTVARRLADLVRTNHLFTRGKARAVRYFAAPISGSANAVLPSIQAAGEAESYIPISADSKQVRDYVRKPLAARRPVSYRREFLENYLPNKTWYLPLAVRKRLLLLGRPWQDERPAGTYAHDILARLLIDLSWASSRLEGNTYTRLETQQLIELGRVAEGKDQREAQMILNHKAAIEMLVDNANEIGFNAFTFKNLHAQLSENLLADPTMSGRLRTQVVDIQGTVFHPLAIPQQVEDYFMMILQKAEAIQDPFEQAFFTMVHIPYLQPFIDVNKRVSRLGANISLIKQNLCPLSFVDVPEKAYIEGTLGIYELNRIDLLRDVFIWAYERSCQRFRAIQEAAATPDPVRMRNREALSTVISDIVKNGAGDSREDVRSRAGDLVRPADLEQFLDIAVQELQNLHEGNVARYRVRLSEFKSWKSKQKRKR